MSRYGKPDLSYLPRQVDGMDVIRPYVDQWAAYVPLEQCQRHAAAQHTAGYRAALEAVDEALDHINLIEGTDWRHTIRQELNVMWADAKGAAS